MATMKEIEDRVLLLFYTNPGIQDEVDIADFLNQDLRTVSLVCDKLLKEGKIKRKSP